MYNQNLSDNDLISGCIANNRQMQHELYKRFAPKMYTVCLRYCKNTEDAQDVLQEGFIKIYKNIEKFRGEGSFEGWVRRIFVNTAIESFRKSVTVQAVSESQENSIEDDNLSVLDNMAEKDILNLIQKLSPGYKQVFNMYVVEGYSHKEIAELLGISEGTSKSQLARAKALMQKLVIEELDRRSIKKKDNG